jgi:uncharacterized protein YuzE
MNSRHEAQEDEGDEEVRRKRKIVAFEIWRAQED